MLFETSSENLKTKYLLLHDIKSFIWIKTCWNNFLLFANQSNFPTNFFFFFFFSVKIEFEVRKMLLTLFIFTQKNTLQLHWHFLWKKNCGFVDSEFVKICQKQVIYNNFYFCLPKWKSPTQKPTYVIILP